MTRPASADEPTQDEIDRIGPEFMSPHEVAIRVRDIIHEMLMTRRGIEITHLTAMERANNVAAALVAEFEIKGRPR